MRQGNMFSLLSGVRARKKFEVRSDFVLRETHRNDQRIGFYQNVFLSAPFVMGFNNLLKTWGADRGTHPRGGEGVSL